MTVTNTNDSGTGSFRDALEYSQYHPNTVIKFNLPGPGTISPTTRLPSVIGSGTIIDGTSQPGYSGTPLIVIDGVYLGGAYIDGIYLNCVGSEVKGLAVRNFGASGITIVGETCYNNKVTGCRVSACSTGIDLIVSHHNTIGGLTAAERNYCFLNKEYGIQVHGAQESNNVVTSNTHDNVIQGNYVGTNIAGTAAAPNGLGGIILHVGAVNTLVGGTVPGAGNLISGNNGEGLTLRNWESTGNLIQGNLIGTDATGYKALPNKKGVYIEYLCDGNTIGGNSAAAHNVISGNTGTGVLIEWSQKNKFLGNYVGTDISGQGALGNGGEGFLLEGSNNVVGGTNSGEGNRIAFNAGPGVSVGRTDTVGNSIRGNSIYSNQNYGIDLWSDGFHADGITPNDTGDVDTDAPNSLQNYPVIKNVTASGANIVFNGTLNSVPGTNFAVDFFRSVNNAEGQAQTYLGSTTVTTNGTGDATLLASVPFAGEGTCFTATATRISTGDTSEISRPFTAMLPDYRHAVSGRCVTVRADATYATTQRLGMPNSVVSLLNTSGLVVAQATTDADGNFLIPTVNPGNYTITATAVREGQADVVMDPPTRSITVAGADVAAPRFALYSIFGIVKKPSGSANVPLAGATVSLINPKGVLIATRTTGTDGRYEFRNQRATTFTVKATASGYSFPTKTVTLQTTGQTWSPCARANIVGVPAGNVSGSARRF